MCYVLLPFLKIDTHLYVGDKWKWKWVIFFLSFRISEWSKGKNQFGFMSACVRNVFYLLLHWYMEMNPHIFLCCPSASTLIRFLAKKYLQGDLNRAFESSALHNYSSQMRRAGRISALLTPLTTPNRPESTSQPCVWLTDCTVGREMWWERVA